MARCGRERVVEWSCVRTAAAAGVVATCVLAMAARGGGNSSSRSGDSAAPRARTRASSRRREAGEDRYARAKRGRVTLMHSAAGVSGPVYIARAQPPRAEARRIGASARGRWCAARAVQQSKASRRGRRQTSWRKVSAAAHGGPKEPAVCPAPLERRLQRAACLRIRRSMRQSSAVRRGGRSLRARRRGVVAVCRSVFFLYAWIPMWLMGASTEVTARVARRPRRGEQRCMRAVPGPRRGRRRRSRRWTWSVCCALRACRPGGRRCVRAATAQAVGGAGAPAAAG